MDSLFDVYPLQDIHIVRGAGSELWDRSGRRYLDMYGGHAVISVGHSHPYWLQQVQQQLGQLAFYSNSVKLDIQEQAAEMLATVAGKPGFKVFFCNSGAEANENALKVAGFVTGRKKVICFTGAFHGRTSLAVAATDDTKIQAPVNYTGDIIRLPFNDVAQLESCFASYGKSIAAVITEGIQGVGGIKAATPGFLQSIRAQCDKYGALYIADAVQCGCGRTGQYFSHDIAGVNADIYTMAKGIGNGYPAGAVLINAGIAPWHGMLGTTFGGNPPACAAVLAVHELITNQQLMRQAEEKGNYLKSALETIEGLMNVRGRGLMLGFDTSEQLTGLRGRLLAEYGIFTGAAKPGTVRILPAYTVTYPQLDELVAAIGQFVAS